MAWPQTVSEWAALVLAIYGAVLSTILAVYGFRKERKRVKILCIRVETTDYLLQPDDAIQISAVNLGQRPVTITSIGLMDIKGKRWTGKYAIRTNELPKEISDGARVDSLISIRGLLPRLDAEIEQPKKFRFAYAYALDAEGHEYKGKIPKWLPTFLNIGK